MSDSDLMPAVTVDASTPEKIVERTVLTGKGFRARFILLDLLNILGFAAFFRYTIFAMDEQAMYTKPFLYWGLLAGTTFAAYMATAYFSIRRTSAALQAVHIVGQHFEGTDSDLAKFVLELQASGNKVIAKPRNGGDVVKLKYEIDDNGDEVITVEQ